MLLEILASSSDFQQAIGADEHLRVAWFYYAMADRLDMDLRIATSVKDHSGGRAIGTYVSSVVARHVLDQGGRWADRARVLDDWYVTAAESIMDLAGQRVGMLYVGVIRGGSAATP